MQALAEAGFRDGHRDQRFGGRRAAGYGRSDVTEFCTVIYGHDSHGSKPGPEMMTAFCAETGLTPGQVTMVGDTMTDLNFARNAGRIRALG